LGSIASYCLVDHKSAWFVEGLNNKIRKIPRPGLWIPDEEYFRLKILTCMLENVKFTPLKNAMILLLTSVIDSFPDTLCILPIVVSPSYGRQFRAAMADAKRAVALAPSIA